MLILGSANWTLSSRCNCEMSMMMDLTSQPQLANQVREKMDSYMAKGVAKTTFAENEGAKTRSASAPKIGQTQRRFIEAQNHQAFMEG